MSLLTNNSAMVALQTLKGINKNLEGVQSQISTGKAVASAKDNAAVWAVSKVMESDVKGFKEISSSLALGDSTVAVGRQAAETVTDLLTEIKGKIVASQEENVDRSKIQTDIDRLTDQIESVVGAAQFNGLNLVDGSSTDDVNILSSLDRSSDGNVAASDIAVSRQNMTTTQGKLGTGLGNTDLSTNVASTSATLSSAAVNDDGAGTPQAATFQISTSFTATDSLTFDVGGTKVSFAAGELTGTDADDLDTIKAKIDAAQIEGITVAEDGTDTLTFSSTNSFSDVTVQGSVTGAGQLNTAATASRTLDERAEAFTFSDVKVNEGDGYQIGFSGSAAGTFTYVASAGDTMEDVAKGLQLAIDGAHNEDIKTEVSKDAGTGQWVLKIDNDNSDTTAGGNVTVAITANNDTNDNAVATGGLAGLDDFDVTNGDSADKALKNIETLIQNSIDAASQFGSDQGRIEIQSEFIGKLTDSLKSGIGSLVDADMEETSARLQALQVQQQLGTQSLSIANQAPQSILSLFR